MAKELTIRFIRNYTVEPLGNSLQEQAAQFGLRVETVFGAFDNLGAEIAGLVTLPEPPAYVMVTVDLDYFSGGIHSPNWTLTQAADELRLLLSAIDGVLAGTFVLISTFIPPFKTTLPWAPGHPLFGRSAAALELNGILRAFVADRPDRCGLVDFERIAARLGEAETLDKRFGLMMKAPFKPGFIDAAAREVLRFLRCRHLPPKKVLVLDCDNTLWGGLAGELGVENIQLDPYEYPGVAYYRFQSEVLTLAQKGVLICLCSKNEESVVWEVLDRHPHCLIKRENIAAHRINWANKAANIKELALELNLALDSMVFVDDEPAECELVRSQFPEVSVIKTPGKVYDLPGMLGGSDYFDRISVSKEDRDRTQYYQAEKGRRDLEKRHVDVNGFLKDLQMRAAVYLVESGDLPRAAQLCQRTNQFNLTTRRHGEPELSLFLSNPEVRMFLLQVADRFGSMGVSGLIIFRREGGTVEIETFLMSCRIIGRLLDRALFCEALRKLRMSWDFHELRSKYVPTARNGIVSGLWSDYGFSRIPAGGEAQSFACLIENLKVTLPAVIQFVERA